MIVYLAGPMSGLPGFNLPAFAAAARRLRADGFEVLSPAEIDDGGAQREWRWYMARCLPLVCEAEAIVVLPGWERSRGASLEVFVGCQLGLPVWPIADVERMHAEWLAAAEGVTS